MELIKIIFIAATIAIVFENASVCKYNIHILQNYVWAKKTKNIQKL